MLHAVIMAGGAGTRFWPLSRIVLPKQLLSFGSEHSLLQQAVARLAPVVATSNISVITNQALVAAITAQLPTLNPTAIIGEPAKRDTAPCIGLAAALIAAEDPSAIMLVMPSDHIIEPVQEFQTALQQAVDIVEEDCSRLVTFGIHPDRPADTYGYIQRGDALQNGVYQVKEFKEKPTRETATQYLQQGEYYWNAGIFVWKASTILAALQQSQPEMMSRIEKIVARREDTDFQQVFETEFSAIDGISIDYAVLENYDNVVVVEAPFQWDDIGSWQALARLFPADENNNTVLGKHLGIETSGSIIQSTDHHLVATVGVRNLIIIHTEDATLVANKQDEESVRQLVRLLESSNESSHL